MTGISADGIQGDLTMMFLTLMDEDFPGTLNAEDHPGVHRERYHLAETLTEGACLMNLIEEGALQESLTVEAHLETLMPEVNWKILIVEGVCLENLIAGELQEGPEKNLMKLKNMIQERAPQKIMMVHSKTLTKGVFLVPSEEEARQENLITELVYQKILIAVEVHLEM